jgi:hypothetical protein
MSLQSIQDRTFYDSLPESLFTPLFRKLTKDQYATVKHAISALPIPAMMLFEHPETGVYRAAPYWSPDQPLPASGFDRELNLARIMEGSVQWTPGWQPLTLDETMDMPKVMNAIETEVDRVTREVMQWARQDNIETEDSETGKRVEEKVCANATNTLNDRRATPYVATASILVRVALQRMEQGAGRGTTSKIGSLVRHADAIERTAWAPALSCITQALLEPEAREVSLARARGDDFSRVWHRTIQQRLDFLNAYTAHTDFTPKGWAVTLSKLPEPTSDEATRQSLHDQHLQDIQDGLDGRWEAERDQTAKERSLSIFMNQRNKSHPPETSGPEASGWAATRRG